MQSNNLNISINITESDVSIKIPTSQTNETFDGCESDHETEEECHPDDTDCDSSDCNCGND